MAKSKQKTIRKKGPSGAALKRPTKRPALKTKPTAPGSRRILLVASEAVPYVKTGGLADAVGALAKHLKKRGHDVRLMLPRYWGVDRVKYGLKRILSPMGVPMGNRTVWCEIWHGTSEGYPVYFIEHENYFGRSGLYDDGYREYDDNAARFGFFAKACLQLCRDLKFQPDVIHCNDWQTAMTPAYLKMEGDAFFKNTASVFSIHNIAYQGTFKPDHLPFLGLDASHFTESKFESFGAINFMKGAIFFADAINTVSPTYAEEILSEPGGNGISTFLQRRREDLFGILNGVDYDHWDPKTDPFIPARYSSKDLTGKAECKRELQREFLLEEYSDVPIVGIISRFAHQKGMDMLTPVMADILRNMMVQFVILGSGEKWIEDFFGGLPALHPGRVGAWIGYDNRRAHLIEAGADFFLMPSIYEPCGLNQIYSMRYGTLPIVRETGGLRDTVAQYQELTGEGTGFRFQAATPKAVYDTIGWAVSTYYDRPAHLHQMRQQAMKMNFSWEASAQEYERLYERALWRRAHWN